MHYSLYLQLFWRSGIRRSIYGYPKCRDFAYKQESWMVVPVMAALLYQEVNSQSLCGCLGPVSIWRCRLTSIGIPIIKIRRSHDRPIFIMEISYMIRLYIERGTAAHREFNAMFMNLMSQLEEPFSWNQGLGRQYAYVASQTLIELCK